MKKIKFTFILVSIICIALFGSCSLINEGEELGKISIQFFDKLSHKDYNGCTSLMDLETLTAHGTNIDTLKLGIEQCENALEAKFGADYKYELATVKFHAISNNRFDENSRFALIQVSNDKIYGICKIVFDVKSDKIATFYLPNKVFKIKKLTVFWLSSIIAILIIAFIILTLKKVYKSDIKYKWIYYIITVVLSAPTLAYSPTDGFVFKLMNIHLFMGISFTYGVYSKLLWSFALPLGALITRYKIYSHSNKSDDEKVEVGFEKPNKNKEIVQDESAQYSVISYKTNHGIITIEQELPNPNIGEKIFLNGKPAVFGKYKIGFMSYVKVEDGIIIGFSVFK